MIVRGGQGIGDLGWWNPVSTVKNTFSAAKKAVSSLPSTAYSVGRIVTAPTRFGVDLATSITRGTTSGVTSLAGKVLGAPFGVIRAAAGGLSSGFKSSAGGGSSRAATVAAAQEASGQVTTQPSSGGDVTMAPGSPLTNDPNAPTGTEGQGAPQTLGDKFSAMSLPAKVGVIGGLGAAAYLLYKRLGGRRSKSH